MAAENVAIGTSANGHDCPPGASPVL